MRIGIDLDDTICRTTEIVHKYLEIYSEKTHLNSLDIMNDEELKEEFFDKYIRNIYEEVEIKREAKKVLKRLKSKGNEIYIITSRRDRITKDGKTILEITEEWFNKNDIMIDKIILSGNGDKKALVCKNNSINLMIEDNPYNYKKISTIGIKCLLFDDREKYNLKQDYVTSWIDIEKYIERNWKNEKNN